MVKHDETRVPEGRTRVLLQLIFRGGGSEGYLKNSALGNEWYRDVLEFSVPRARALHTVVGWCSTGENEAASLKSYGEDILKNSMRPSVPKY